MTALLGDEDEQVRRRALRALEAIGPGAQSARDSLVPMLSDQSDMVRQLAVRALGSVDRNPRRTLALFRVAHDQSSVVRRVAREAIAAITEGHN
ncbi:MAG: HEAT repeat domain-containing protein [Planctomycetota bacterium]